jgi:hypothetical protein
MTDTAHASEAARTEAIRVGIESEDSFRGIEWGQYTQRNDHPWLSLLYTSGDDEDHARSGLRPDSEVFRHTTPVHRPVERWAIRPQF